MTLSGSARTYRARALPGDDRRCGWINTLSQRAPAPSWRGEGDADCVIVGAGFVGLAAARRLAELRPGWRVVVLDAQRAGDGASGRSSGFIVDLAGFIAAMAPEDGRRFIRLSRFGIEQLRRRVEESVIPCDWDERGFLHVAAGDVGLRSLTGLGRWLEGLEEPFERLDGAGMEEVTGSRFYRAGIRLPGSVLVQSAALVHGLAAGLPSGVELYERSPVVSIEAGRTPSLRTADGVVRAGHVIVALNGYAPALGFLRRRVFPLHTFGSLSRPLRADEQEAIGGEREWGLLAQDPLGSSLRRTRDQRLLIRNTVRYAPRLSVPERVLERMRALHHRTLLRRFPELRALELEHTWSGAMGATPDQRPFFGWLDRGIAGAAGFTGAGIAFGTACGALLAELVAGEESGLLEDVLSLPGPRWIPPEPFLSTGIRLRVAWMNATAGATL